MCFILWALFIQYKFYWNDCVKKTKPKRCFELFVCFRRLPKIFMDLGWKFFICASYHLVFIYLKWHWFVYNDFSFQLFPCLFMQINSFLCRDFADVQIFSSSYRLDCFNWCNCGFHCNNHTVMVIIIQIIYIV